MNLFRSICVASVLSVFAAGLGCSSDEPDVVDDGKTISTVEITTGIDSLTKGSSMQFQAMAKYADGSSKDVSTDSDTTWNTSDAAIATVDDEGKVTAVDEGMVDITATYLGMEAEETFLVTP